MFLRQTWSKRVEQELACAVKASDITARKAHIELAARHLEADGNDFDAAREMLTVALFSSLAFPKDE